MNIYYKYPRLFIDFPLVDKGDVPLEQSHAHYLKNVLRKEVGQGLRIFNGRDGEWLAEISELSKKLGVAALKEKTQDQPEYERKIHLIFSPIKKLRMEFVIEKAVELGVTDIYPVLMKRTENRKINTDRIESQIIEAAEQCERLTLPTLHHMVELRKFLSAWKNETTIYACIERIETKPLHDYNETFEKESAFLVGPEGGFHDEEIDRITAHKATKPVTLGPKILRAETAALYCLSNT